MRFSILFPLFSDRGMARRALAAWRRQDYAPDQFQVLLIPARDAPSSGLLDRLLPSDRVLNATAMHITEAYDLGARAAEGEYLLLTEAHCEPARDCLTHLWHYLSERPHLAGACLRSIPVCDNHYAQIDARTFEEGYRVFRQDGDWRKVNVHGFALRKTVYEAVGGLACRYGRFAEMMLAAELRDRGHRLGYAEDAAVLHHYRSTLAELVEGIDEYIRGESIYRAEHPGPDRIGYSFLPDSDNPFASEHKAMRWAVCRTLGFDWLFRGGCLRKAIGRAFWPALANGLAASLFGSRWHTGSAALLTKLAMGRCWWRRDNAHKLDAAYRDLIVQATRLSRWRFLAEQPAESNGLPPARSRYSILEIPEGHSLGLHNVEWSDGRPFRWTGRCAAFRLHADEAPRAVHIDTMNLRHFPMPLNLSAFLNGSALTVSDLPNGMIRLDVSQPARPAAGEQILVLACNPFSPWSVGVCDQRELGLPIASLELVAAEVSTPMPIRAAA